MTSTLISPFGTEIIGSIAALLTTISWLPQALKTLRTRQTRDISLPAQVMLFIGIFLWLVYGILLMSWPLIGANIVTLVLVGTILAMKIRYG